MSEVDGAVSGFSSTIHNLSPKAWAAIVVGGVGIGLYLRHRGTFSSATTTTATDGTDTLTSDGTTSGVSDATGAIAGTTVAGGALQFAAPISTNDDWRKAAENYLLAQNDDPVLVDAAISDYLTGQPLSANMNAVIEAALRYVGSTPYMVPAPNVQTPATTTDTTTNQTPTQVTTTTPETTVTTQPLSPAPAATQAPVGISPDSVVTAPPPGIAVQVSNPIPNDNSAVVVGTTPQGNTYVYGGSQAQASELTNQPAPTPAKGLASFLKK